MSGAKGVAPCTRRSAIVFKTAFPRALNGSVSGANKKSKCCLFFLCGDVVNEYKLHALALKSVLLCTHTSWAQPMVPSMDRKQMRGQ